MRFAQFLAYLAALYGAAGIADHTFQSPDVGEVWQFSSVCLFLAVLVRFGVFLNHCRNNPEAEDKE